MELEQALLYSKNIKESKEKVDEGAVGNAIKTGWNAFKNTVVAGAKAGAAIGNNVLNQAAGTRGVQYFNNGPKPVDPKAFQGFCNELKKFIDGVQVTDAGDGGKNNGDNAEQNQGNDQNNAQNGDQNNGQNNDQNQNTEQNQQQEGGSN